MPLSAATLERELEQRYFTKGADNFHQPPPRFAAAYRKYAKDARSCQGQGAAPGALEAAELKLSAYLVTALPRCRDPLSFCSAFATGLSAFWLAPPVPFLGGTPGAVSAANPATLQAALLRVCVTATALGRAGTLTPAKVARLWARALDAWTRTVVVVHGPPGACTGPIV